MADFDYQSVIRRILDRNRWGSEGELAKALGIAPNTWTAYKRGDRSFGLHEIAKICDVLGVSEHWLLFGEEDDPVDEVLRQAQRRDLMIQRSYTEAGPDLELVSPETFTRSEIAEITGGQIHPDVLEDIGNIVREVHEQAGIALPRGSGLRFAIARYNELIRAGADLLDEEEIKARLVIMRKDMTRELVSAKAEPGTGKQSA